MTEVRFHADLDTYGQYDVISDEMHDHLPAGYSIPVISEDDEGLTVLELRSEDEPIDPLDDDGVEALHNKLLDALESALFDIYSTEGNPDAGADSSEARAQIYSWVQLIEDED